jgi:hypothetical protein
MVEMQLPSGSSSADGVAVLHVSTGRFLGPTLVLVERDDAIAFESAEVAKRFLTWHACEPCYDVVTLSAPFAARTISSLS